ncbi:hypothetical protein BG011_009015 [Mortierella polycephala]|uniref:RNA polymerase II assembly factor Rtp1 C-terminal domain-containing protein n=1 Tax=Mortierella polycephala TaxID=41804 RepID=A0A9P6U7W3_9FUNG|nr:hypothetical protein BG011_009015 [Mortierella polycephala]
MALDHALKTDLRMISAMVGKRLDIQNIDQELEQRLQDLAEMRAGTLDPLGHSESNGTDSSNKSPEGEHSVDLRVEFTLKSVQLLAQLEQDLMALVRDRDANDPMNDKELLGLVDQRMIHTMLELIICWGIYPCLLPGVGMPLNRRVRSNIVQTELFTVGSGSSTTDSPEDRILLTNRLWTIIEPLARITVAYSTSVTMFTTLGSILANRHVPDLYAALLQLGYQPLSKPNGPPSAATKNTDLAPAPDAPSARITKITPGSLLSKAAKSPAKDSTGGSMGAQQGLQSSEQIGPEKSRQLQQKEESAKLFHDLFWSTEAARSLESLTTLLSSSSPSHPTPVWLKSVSGRFLSQILLKRGGVRVVLEYMQGGNEAVKLDQLEKIARLVTSVPDQMSSVQEYYRTICPELLEILEMDMKLVAPMTEQGKQCAQDMQRMTTPPSPQLVQTATFVVGKLLVKNPAICQVEIVAKEVEPLWKWGTRANHKGPEAADTVPRQHGDVDDETGLDSLIASEYEVVKSVMFLHSFLVGNEPSPVLFQSFLAQAAQGLYRLYEFTTKVRSVLREKAKEILVVYLRILDAAETVEFLKTVVMRRRSPVSATKPWQNLVSLDGRRIEELAEMGSVGECYFAPGPSGGAVLRRRSTQDRHAATQLELDVEVFMEFLGELETPGHEGEILGDLYMYLLDEYQAGKARGSNAVSPRRMLTMLQLILNMTQNLGPSIMSKVTQIIGLANNILEHQVSSEAKEQEDGEDDATDAAAEDTKEADMEILGLVLTLLSAILNENEHLSQQDSHLLGLTLVHLKRLADHPLIDIRRVAHDLQTLIPTRLNNASTAADAPKKTEMEIEMEKYASALAALQDSLLPVRAHGLHILREMILAKSVVLTKPLVTDGGDGVGGEEAERELNHALDIFVQHVQEPDSFIYLNAVKGLAALTDAHGPEILRKLMKIYANENGRQTLDTRLRIGEALVQTVQRCGEALGGYLDALLPGLYKVMDTAMDKQVVEAREEERRVMQDKAKAKKASEALLSPEERQKKWRTERNQRAQHIGSGNQPGQMEDENEDEGQDQIIDEVSLLRASALTILATAAETCPTALLPEMRFLVDWVLSILDLGRQIEVRRAATLVLVLLFRALGGNSLYRIEGDQLKRVYRTLRYVEQVDEDALCRAQARAGIADLDGIVRMEMNPEGGSRPRRTPGDGVSLSGVGLTEIRYR